ncbi:hypothetical protein MJT46_015367 [Ovis ammon polii x Ovis aries]|nr:hypothetical protein MJT46_015367 [Ovis ammon polii x Ovis aries]
MEQVRMQRVSKVLVGDDGELEGNTDGAAAAEDNDGTVNDEDDSDDCPPSSPCYLPSSFTCFNLLNPVATRLCSSLGPLSKENALHPVLSNADFVFFFRNSSSQREFGGKTELAEYGFDYGDLYQRVIILPLTIQMGLLLRVEVGTISTYAGKSDGCLFLSLVTQTVRHPTKSTELLLYNRMELHGIFIRAGLHFSPSQRGYSMNFAVLHSLQRVEAPALSGFHFPATCILLH